MIDMIHVVLLASMSDYAMYPIGQMSQRLFVYL